MFGWTRDQAWHVLEKRSTVKPPHPQTHFFVGKGALIVLLPSYKHPHTPLPPFAL